MSSVPDIEQAGEALVGSVLAGRYRIELLLGAGGMGSVYRAEHVHMRKAVAVKVLHRELTLFPEIVTRFEREAVAAARIEHPNVAAATDFGRLDDGSFYLVLEFVEGKSLGALLKDEGTLSEQRSLQIAHQIADALGAAHAAGVVHRDLKPENVMLLERDGLADFVKVLDFGIAKVKLDAAATGEQQLTQMGTVFGTPEYMSPEQAQGVEVDARTDIYALGILLYEMLSGTSPFRHEEIVVMLTRQITMEPPPLPDSISERTRELTRKLLEKDAKDRPQSAAEVRDRIDAILIGTSPTSAPPPLSPTPAATVVSTGAELAEAAHAHTALALSGPGRAPFSAVFALFRRAGLSRPVAIGGYAVPLGVVLATLGVVLVVLALTTTLIVIASGGAEGAAAAVSADEDEPADADILAVVAGAETGDRTAIAVLAGRPAEARSVVEWRALGHGYCAIGELKACLDVYAAGMARKSELTRDPIVIGDLRHAAERDPVSGQALDLAARLLGAVGADLLYDVWESGKAPSPTAAAKHARALLDEEPAKSRQSPALRALFTLSAAMKKPRCGELKKLLPEIGRDADERTLPMLNRLNERRGCGFFGLSDCYGCLRAGKELASALAAARSRPKPSFALRERASAPPAPSGSR